MQSLSRATALRDCLNESEAIALGASIVLEGYNGQLESLIKSVEHVADRAQVLTQAQKRVDAALKQTSQLLQHLDTPSRVEAKIKMGPRGGLAEFASAVDRLIECVTELSKHRGLQAVEKSLKTAVALQKEATVLASDEFKAVLKRSSTIYDLKTIRADPDAFKPSALNNTQDICSAEQVDKLKRLHDALVKLEDDSSTRVFVDIRCNTLDKSMLASLEMKLLTPEEFNKLTWSAAEARINVWISVILGSCGQLAIEQRLAHQIFGARKGKEAYQQLMNPIVQYLHIRFICKILGSKCVPEKIYVTLEAGEQLQASLSNLTIDIQAVSMDNSVLNAQFSALAGNEIYSDRGQISRALAEDARTTFNQFCVSMRQEAIRQTVGSASVHTLTAQVMTLLKRLAKFTSCALILFSDEPIPREPFNSSDTQQDGTMQRGIEQLLDLLWETLVGIASTCKNKAMAYLFLMTNAHFQVKMIQQSPTLQVVSRAWQEQCEAKLEESGEKYQVHSWGEILEIMGNPDEVPEMRTLNWLKDQKSLKEKWKRINHHLAQLIAEEKNWSIPDAILRLNLRKAICEDFIPAYEKVWINHQKVRFTKHPGKYFKYSPEALTQIIQRELFHCETAAKDVWAEPSVRPAGSGSNRFYTS